MSRPEWTTLPLREAHDGPAPAERDVVLEAWEDTPRGRERVREAIAPDGSVRRTVVGRACHCNDGACVLCDDDGMVPA